MDPNATLRDINDALDVDDTEAADLACEDLYRWLTFNAFAPDWTRYPAATEYYRAYVARMERS